MVLVQTIAMSITVERWIVAVAALAICAMAAAQDSPARDELRLAVERVRYGAEPGEGITVLAAGNLVADFYERRNFLPAWLDANKVDELVELVNATYLDGLSPVDYHEEPIVMLARDLSEESSMGPRDRATAELLLTDALISLTHHLRYGKVDPRSHQPVWNFAVVSDGHDPVEWIELAVSAPSLIDFVRSEIPRGAFYNRLRASLAEHRDIAARGRWPEIPQGSTIRPGDSDSRIAALSARLALTKDFDSSGPHDALQVYDEGLQTGVRNFQTRHGLEADGIVGPRTLRSLNVPVEVRIRQLRLTLERARWVLDGIEDNVVVVNIAGFRAYVVSGRKIFWETRVVVGTPHQQTPVFRDELQYIVFNPSWTVPYSIATREMLPQLQADSTYFAARDFDILDKEGNLIDPIDVDWEQVTRRNFGYTFIQRPGPNNALGQVKFMFPNEHAVYLHDTPSREQFGLAERAFSHGCIRVADPLHLAELLLRNDGWDRKRIEEAVQSNKTRTVYLSERVPILLLYWTASVDPDGLVHFHDDVYKRDPAIAQALDAPFSIGRAQNPENPGIPTQSPYRFE